MSKSAATILLPGPRVAVRVPSSVEYRRSVRSTARHGQAAHATLGHLATLDHSHDPAAWVSINPSFMEWRADNFDYEVPTWIKNLGGWVRDVVEFCYPGICPACRAACAAGQDLCPPCTNELATLAQAPACFSCGKSLAYHNAPCPHCGGRGVAHYERVIRLGKFESPIRDLVHKLKYHRAYTVGEIFADRLLQQDHVESLLLEADCLLPVPLHGVREFARGYNQAAVIAERLSRVTGIPLAHGVCRVRNTEPQTHLHANAQRMANLKGAFQLRDGKQIIGRRVVVVDDVMTTGATLQTLARTLRPAKPATLSALVVAVAEQNH